MTNDIFQINQKLILNEGGVDLDFLNRSLALLNERKIDFGDLFFLHQCKERFTLDESIIKSGSFAIECGLGIRAVVGEKTGFAYSDSVDKDSIVDCIKAARSICSGHNCNGVNATVNYRKTKPLYSIDDPLISLTKEQKTKILRKLDEKARAKDPRVIQVSASINATYRHMLVLDNDGHLSADIKPFAQLVLSVILKDHDKVESGFTSTGGAYLLERFDDDNLLNYLVDEAVRIASVNLEAIAAPSGMMPVVLGNGWPGVLIHEAVGHGLEGDFNRIGSSLFTGKIGQKVASDACTIVDDGTICDRRGSQTIDDEGTRTSHNVLIENGILKGYMMDRQNAMLMGQQSTGNGRRESYNCLPMPRMTNTYMQAGKYDKEEIITSVDKGIYAVNFSGGQVDITSGQFVFSTSEAYLIEKGKITVPIKGATLIGNGPETMSLVSMVGNDLKFDAGVGMCGKQGQSIPVGIGQPTLKIDSITVGGTSL